MVMVGLMVPPRLPKDNVDVPVLLTNSSAFPVIVSPALPLAGPVPEMVSEVSRKLPAMSLFVVDVPLAHVPVKTRAVDEPLVGVDDQLPPEAPLDQFVVVPGLPDGFVQVCADAFGPATPTSATSTTAANRNERLMGSPREGAWGQDRPRPTSQT